uniref:Rab3 GTPase-activating protein catalytic subunit n=1 Tax=Denticeps clupeoides TaxID=299321 RepID=A0AAY4B730_9TELE
MRSPSVSLQGCGLTPLPPVSIAIRFTYVLQDWQQCSWPQQPPDFDALLSGEVGGVEFGKLPFGACEDPVSELHLSATWPHLTEGIVVDNDVYSDLDPLQAPQWSVRVRKAENPQCLLGKNAKGQYNSDISHALSKLTEPTAVPLPKLSVSNMVHSARKRIRRHRRADESPLSSDLLNSILLVREAKVCLSLHMGKENLFSQLKSAPLDSLTYRLALCICLVNFYHGGARGVAHLWQEFVLEMRYRWENNFLIHGLDGGPPDLRCCLLHQKLQMLNCCIERKRARDDGRKGTGVEKKGGCENGRLAPQSASLTSASPGKSWESWSDSEEEFFECLSDTDELKEVQPTEQERSASGRTKPEGRLQPHDKLTLLNSDEPLYIPITQEPGPMTEDALEEQSEVLAKLGTSAEGAHLRARMQSACLLSDMESFKAANPGCLLEDFVRWYSPRDYVEEEVTDENGQTVVRGDLSTRMKIPGNMWVEAWETAKATPARRQRRLFDDTKEAEKVLHYLAVQKPSDLTRHLLSCVIHAAILKEKEEEVAEDIPSVRRSIQQLVSLAGKLLHHPSPDYKKLEDLISQVAGVEAVIAHARSLKAKFGLGKNDTGEEVEGLRRFVISLLDEPEVSVIDAGRSYVGSIIHKLFVSAQRAALLAPMEDEVGRTDDRKATAGGAVGADFPPPAGREILLRTCVPRPAPYSKPLPQRLFCVLMKEDFRLAGAFSSDTSFF